MRYLLFLLLTSCSQSSVTNLHGDTSNQLSLDKHYQQYEKFVEIYDSSSDNRLSLEEFLNQTKPSWISREEFSENLNSAFDAYDIDCDKYIDAKEMYKSIVLSANKSCLKLQ